MNAGPTLILLLVLAMIFIPLLLGGVEAFMDDGEEEWPDGDDEQDPEALEIPEPPEQD